MKADQECYFVANDAQDQEYLVPTRRVKYYPRRARAVDGTVIKDVRIGDYNPNVTVQKVYPGVALAYELKYAVFNGVTLRLRMPFSGNTIFPIFRNMIYRIISLASTWTMQ